LIVKDDITWLSRAHSRTSLSPASQTVRSRPYRTGSHHRLNVDERCYRHTHDYHSCRVFSNDSFNRTSLNNRQQDSNSYQHRSRRTTSVSCRRCSLSDGIRAQTTQTTIAPVNIFALWHCCSTTTSTITTNGDIDMYNRSRRKSSSSISSSTSRRQGTVSSFNIQRSSVSSNTMPRSNSYLLHRSSTNKVKQTTVWNQQEKAFRQLFAIVFGFTCCFLPYFILYMVVAFCGSCVSERILTATIWLGYVNSTMNPFLYALSNKHFRRTFNRILKRDQRRQSYYN
jgi:hypothetical protein